MAEEYKLVKKSEETDIAALMMPMMMMIMMMSMMASLIPSLSKTSTPVGGDTSLGGINWTWVIEGGESSITEIIGGEAIVPFPGTASKDWHSGIATSGKAGGDIVVIGTPSDTYKVHSLLVTIRYLGAGSKLDIRLYKNVNGVPQCFYDSSFIVGTSTNAIPIIDGEIGITGPLRVELYSDNPIDDGASVDYEFVLGLSI